MWTVALNSSFLDKGGSWIHGIGNGTSPEISIWNNKMNPIYKIAKENNECHS